MNPLIRYEPLVDGLFNEFFRPAYHSGATREDAAPIRFDVRETPEAYLVYAEIPGVKKEDIHVTIEGNQVSISAEVKRESGEKEGDRVLHTERYYGSVFFWVKTMMMLLAAVNVLAFHYGVYNSVGKWDNSATIPYGARLSAAISLILWAVVIMTGRLIAYNWFNAA